MATLIDWSEVHGEISSAFNMYNCESKSQALCHVLLRSLFGLTAEEIADTITDGPNDRGIDAVYIQDSETPVIVHLFQFKYVDDFEKADNNFPSTEIDKLLSFVQELLSKNKNLQNTCNPLLWDKIPEIWDLFDEGTPRFEVHFAANQAALISTQKERISDGVSRYKYFTIYHHDLTSLATLLVQKREPHIDAEIQLVDNQYFERSDGNIRGLIATVQAQDLVSLIRDKVNPELVNLEIFDQNVRVYLTRKRTR